MSNPFTKYFSPTFSSFFATVLSEIISIKRHWKQYVLTCGRLKLSQNGFLMVLLAEYCDTIHPSSLKQNYKTRNCLIRVLKFKIDIMNSKFKPEQSNSNREQWLWVNFFDFCLSAIQYKNCLGKQLNVLTIFQHFPIFYNIDVNVLTCSSLTASKNGLKKFYR